MLNIKDLRTKTNKELGELLVKATADLKKSASAVFNGDEKDFGKPGKLRKDVARIKTLLAEKSEVPNA